MGGRNVSASSGSLHEELFKARGRALTSGLSPHESFVGPFNRTLRGAGPERPPEPRGMLKVRHRLGEGDLGRTLSYLLVSTPTLRRKYLSSEPKCDRPSASSSAEGRTVTWFCWGLKQLL